MKRPKPSQYPKLCKRLQDTLPVGKEAKAYASYTRYCETVGARPATFSEWQYQSRKISELSYHH